MTSSNSTVVRIFAGCFACLVLGCQGTGREPAQEPSPDAKAITDPVTIRMADDPRSDEELIRALGSEFDPDAFSLYHWRPEYPGFYLFFWREMDQVNDEAHTVLFCRLVVKDDPAYATEVLGKALDSGNWLSFCALATGIAHYYPSSEQVVLLLRAYHMERDRKNREAILLALEYYLDYLRDSEVLTDAALAYMYSAWRLEPSQACLAQWARVYACLIPHLGYADRREEDNRIMLPENELAVTFEKERARLQNIPPPDETISLWEDERLSEYPIFPGEDED